MAIRRTLGWVQNPSNLNSLKKVVAAFCFGSKENKWLKEERLPLLLKYNLISKDDYDRFTKLLDVPDIIIEYKDLKGKAGKTRKTAICTGIVQAIIDGQKPHTYSDGIDSVTIKKPYTDDWSAEGFLKWGITCNLIIYDNKTDSCKISDLGTKLVNAKDKA